VIAIKKEKVQQDSEFQQEYEEEEDDTPKKTELLLEMPTSWTPEIDISQEGKS
jgi:hypothetical protein